MTSTGRSSVLRSDETAKWTCTWPKPTCSARWLTPACLHAVGLLGDEDLDAVQRGLKDDIPRNQAEEDSLSRKAIEDVHSQVEFLLTAARGTRPVRRFTAAARATIRCWSTCGFSCAASYAKSSGQCGELFAVLQQLSEKHKEVLMPGYTHWQIAMPSSFGLWFGAYAESLVDDAEMLLAAYRICNKNPLGSAAGYGSSFPLDRKMTTRLLGFDTLDYNVIYAQMGRGKTERVTAQALSSVAATLARLAMDNTMFLSQNFDFISYPAELTTGSSIMPHKKNPDVWELIRGKCNLLQGLPNQIAMMTTNLPLGYNRDLQLLKEVLFPAIADLRSCLSMAAFMLGNIRVKEHILDDPKYDYLFSVETVNNLVLSGVPFREAYRRVGLDIEQGRFKPQRQVHHTHEGSIGNPCNDEISALMQQTVERFDFGKVVSAEADLVK